LAYFYVDRIDDVVRRVVASGGEVVEPPYAEGNLWVATIRDPAGNLFGIWQEGPADTNARKETAETRAG
jgi:predicted enzyme related to lactoylglutathione lyase